MQDVMRTSCRPPSGNGRSGGDRAWGRPPAYVVHSLAAVFTVALACHLLVQLAFLVDPGDPLGLLTVAGGMIAVLVTTLPFIVVFAERAHRDWAGQTPRPLERRG